MNPFFLHRFDKKISRSLVDVLVVFVADPELDGTALLGEVEQEVEQRLAPDEMILLVRASSYEPVRKQLNDSVEIRQLRQRLAGRSSITLLSYDLEGKEHRRETVMTDGRVAGVKLKEIRRRGGTEIFRDRGGFMEANPSFHFENPSKRHTDRFIRLSNILVRQAEIDFLAFCVLPLLSLQITQVYIDTPSLYAIVAAVNAQRTSMDGRLPLRTDNFRSYEGLDTYKFTAIESSNVLISASSSGSLAAKIQKRGFDASQIGHVLYLGKGADQLRVAIDLSFDQESNPRGYAGERTLYEKGECRLCDTGSTAILLRGDQFDIAAPQPDPLTIRKGDAPKGLAERMARLVGARALAVKLGGQRGRRLYHIDSGNLLRHVPFQQRLDYFIRRYVPAGISYCILADEQSRAMAERIEQISGASLKMIRRGEILDRLARIPGTVAAEAAEAGLVEVERSTEEPTIEQNAILVVAAVVEAGRVLLDISRDLRNICPDAPIIYLVGVAEPSSAERRDAMRSNLVQTDRPVQHLFESVEDFLLPAPSGTNAWEQELDFLNRTEENWPSGIRALLEARRDRLQNSAIPLQDELFVPVTVPLPLRKGFVFWPDGLPDRAYTQADVFFTISSVLQHLRTREEKSSGQALRTGWFRQTLLSPENFGRFNDGIIQASILRAARPAEIDYRNDPGLSGQANRIIRRVLMSADRERGEAAVEFLIALGSGRLRVADSDLKELLAPISGGDGLAEGLAELCRNTLLHPAAVPAS